MTRLAIALLVIGLATGSVPTAVAETRVERTVVRNYGPYPAPITGCNEPLGSFACAIVEARQTEGFFKAKITDTHGQPVFVEVLADGEIVTRFCGETSKPIAIKQGSTLTFYVALNHWGISLDCPAYRIKTTGRIRVTLSNLS